MTTLKDLTPEALEEYRVLVSKLVGRPREEKNRETEYDLKKAYHVVRLMNEVEQILIEGTLDLERNKEQLKSIRRGEWTMEQITQYFADKEKLLEELYLKSEIPKYPDEEKIKRVLLQCLEMAYDDVGSIVRLQDTPSVAIKEILEVLSKYKLTQNV